MGSCCCLYCTLVNKIQIGVNGNASSLARSTDSGGTTGAANFGLKLTVYSNTNEDRNMISSLFLILLVVFNFDSPDNPGSSHAGSIHKCLFHLVHSLFIWSKIDTESSRIFQSESSRIFQSDHVATLDCLNQYRYFWQKKEFFIWYHPPLGEGVFLFDIAHP